MVGVRTQSVYRLGPGTFILFSFVFPFFVFFFFLLSVFGFYMLTCSLHGAFHLVF